MWPGMAATSRPSGVTSPATTISTPQSRNAPTAAANPPGCGPAATSSAAPGVDHAMLTGIRLRTPRNAATTPHATHTTSRPDAACPASAPTARSPVSTTANAPANPTTAATMPASTGCANPWATRSIPTSRSVYGTMEDRHMTQPPSTPFSALEDPVGLGPRITALRRERGLSLSELARRAGVGKATLSGMEAGTRNPTLDTLYAIATALELPITSVVADRGGRGPLIHGTAVLVEPLRTWTDADTTYELFRLRIPAGAVQESAAHHVGVTECAVVFAGELRAGPIERPVRVAAGGFAEWAADVRHGYAAIGPDDVHATLLIRSPAAR